MTSIIISFIMAMAPSFNINPELAVAVAKQESSLNPNAIGPVHEVGLFQVRPQYSKFTAKELRQPMVNISEGLRMLAEAKRHCKHQVDMTWIICYNTGIAGAKRIVDPKEFDYYKKVMKRLKKVK